ncbi:MAG: helix-turn-helix transcriptional regulator [Chloroflexota bacterium]|nr:MAG: helix-turn-helix transcriptional regulator [Chloroflexota bacterium]
MKSTTNDDSNLLGKIIKQHRVVIPLTLEQLANVVGVSSSHLGRIERGERTPSARVLRKIAGPLGFSEVELLTLADYLSPESSDIVGGQGQFGRLDPNVARALSQEPVEVQRAVLAICSALKCIAKGSVHENKRQY